jgi:hypothetical protein
MDDKDLVEAQIREIESRIALNEAQAELIRVQAEATLAHANHIHAPEKR